MSCIKFTLATFAVAIVAGVLVFGHGATPLPKNWHQVTTTVVHGQDAVEAHTVWFTHDENGHVLVHHAGLTPVAVIQDKNQEYRLLSDSTFVVNVNDPMSIFHAATRQAIMGCAADLPSPFDDGKDSAHYESATGYDVWFTKTASSQILGTVRSPSNEVRTAFFHPTCIGWLVSDSTTPVNIVDVDSVTHTMFPEEYAVAVVE